MKKDPKKGITYRTTIFSFWVFLFFLGIWDLFNTPYKSIVWFGVLALLIWIYLKFKMVPKYAYLLIILSALTNVFGELFSELFYNSSSYDKLLHLVNPVIIALLIYNMAKNKISDKKMLLMFSVFASISISSFWEVLEYSIDNLFGGYMQGVYVHAPLDYFGKSTIETMGKLEDTMKDLIFGIIGLLLFVIGYFIYDKKNILKKKKIKN